jgi:Rrf2 family protein
MFSKACEYALRAVLYISIKSVNGERLSMLEISKEIDAPVAFTAKILQSLVREGIISSTKGPKGGFFIETKAKEVTINDIVMAIDGVDVLHNCTLGLKECSDEFPCPLHAHVIAYKNHLREILHNTTLQDLVSDLAGGKTFLKKGRVKRSVR